MEAVCEKEARYEVYRQDVWDGDDPPHRRAGDLPWEPFAASISVEHDGMRESLGGGLRAQGETIWWRRPVRS
jgi:hypothetical protein